MAKPNLINIIDDKVNDDYVHSAIKAALNTHDFTGDVYSRDQVDSMLNDKANLIHTHNNHYTTDETDSMLNDKADLIHSHDDLYASKEELLLLDRSDLGGILTGEEENGIQVVYRGGTREEHINGDGFIGSPKEITVDTTDWTLRVHDGITKGGHILAKASTKMQNTKYIENDFSYMDLLSKSDSESYTKNEINNILEVFKKDILKMLGGV